MQINFEKEVIEEINKDRYNTNLSKFINEYFRKFYKSRIEKKIKGEKK